MSIPVWNLRTANFRIIIIRKHRGLLPIAHGAILLKSQGEQDFISTLLTRLQSSADKLSTLIEAGEEDESGDQGKHGKEALQTHPLVLFKQMEGDIEEIEELCKEQEEETATKKTKETLKSFRVAFDDKRTGRSKLLVLIERLHDNIADLGTVAAN